MVNSLGDFTLPGSQDLLPDEVPSLKLGNGIPAKNQFSLGDFSLNGSQQTPPLNTLYKETGFPASVVSKIRPDLWNQTYYYSFSIMEIDRAGRVRQAQPLGQYGLLSNSINLNIPPSSITITNSFASSVTATNGGVIEENNGVVFRGISISGTTGVMPRKGTRHWKPGKAARALQAIAPSTASALNKTLSSVKKAYAGVFGPDEMLADSDDPNTGYYQFWLLHNFFQLYAEIKKKERALCLVFTAAKDNTSYLVTPVSFELKRDASSPLLYKYSIQLKSWKIITPATLETFALYDGIATPDNTSVLKSISNSLRDVRGVISSSRNVLSGFYSDLDSVWDVYAQATLALKEFVGLERDIGDFSRTLVNNKNRIIGGANNQFERALAERDENRELRALVGGSESYTGTAKAKAMVGSAGGDSSQLGAAESLGGEDRSAQNARKDLLASKATTALKDPSFLNTPLSSVSLPDSVSKDIEAQAETARNTTSEQVRGLVKNLQDVSDALAAGSGIMDPTYAKLYGLASPTQTRQPTEEDILLQASLQEAKGHFTNTLATGQIFIEREFDPFAAVNNALPMGDKLTSPQSQYPVFFERGGSLELLAQRYLGTPSRAKDIAILNGLKPPYIDETGFSIPIYSPSGRSFVVDSAANLAINQSVRVESSTTAPTKRRIVNLENLGDSKWRVTVDGPNNLSNYTPASLPTLSARKPGTVGPGDVVMIPSETYTDPNPMRPSSLDALLSSSEKVFKTDLALDSATGRDLLITPAGDLGKLYGYSNAVQSIRLMLETEKGELERHPEYGLPGLPGYKTNNVTANDLVQLINTTISSDPRFASVNSRVIARGETTVVQVSAEGVGATGLVPVEFEIGKS